MLQLYLEVENVKKSTGDTVTGKPVTNPAEVALDTSIVMAHRRCTAEIPTLTEEWRQNGWTPSR
jgi:hypothetical protein